VIATVLVLAKEPLPGKVKTRLVPPLTFEGAAEVAAAALADTLRVVAPVALRRVIVLDGAAGPWLPRGWCVARQRVGGLDRRLADAFDEAGRGVTVLVGMDTPQLRPEQLAAFDASRYDACLGLAVDGGYWAIGLADPTVARAVIPGVPMSTVDTGVEQLRRLRAHGLRVQLLDPLEDIDTFAAAQRVAAEMPSGSALGRTMCALDRAA
jgi:glycosyltransferase A (GT-A) superfamily protein (DUF2064 family)